MFGARMLCGCGDRRTRPHICSCPWSRCLQSAAILRGLSLLIPPRALPLFSWAELERLVCGDKTVDVSLMRRHTVYVSISSAPPPSPCPTNSLFFAFLAAARADRADLLAVSWHLRP